MPKLSRNRLHALAGDTKDMAPSTYQGPDAQKPAGVSAGVSARPKPTVKCAHHAYACMSTGYLKDPRHLKFVGATCTLEDNAQGGMRYSSVTAQSC